MIKFLDLQAINAQYASELKRAAEDVIDSGWYLLGKHINEFEKNLSEYIGTSNSIAVANGLDALKIIIRAYKELGVFDEGDEIIVPSNTYIASILAVSENRLKPVFVEPDIDTYNLDISKIEEKINSRTKAIMVVHLYGRACWSEELEALATKYQLKIIEDNAQAFGAKWNGVMTGNLGDAAGFSFYPGKNLGALGDAGAVTAKDDLLAETVRTLANYGSKVKYHNQFQGYNSRMDEMQAAFLNVKMKYAEQEIAARRKVADYYLQNISNTSITLPQMPENPEEHVWHVFAIRHGQRNKLQAYLHDNGVQTLIHYPLPPHKQEAYDYMNGHSYPISEKIHGGILSLPISPVLSEEECSKVVSCLEQFKL